jgi:D-amino-acid dehydrogenase
MAGHTVLIGGGIVGASAAYYLAQRGVSVTLVEQGELCSGASQGNAGQVTPGHLPLPQPGTLARNLRWLLTSTSPLYVAPRWDFALLKWLWRFQQACNPRHLQHATRILCELGAASARLIEQLAPEIGLPYHHPGRLEVCRGDRSWQFACEEARLLQQFGYASRILRGAEVADFEPAMAAPVAGAVYYPDSGYCHPQTMVMKLADAARQRGAVIRTQTTVTGLDIRRGQAVAVRCGEETITADAVAITCGAWAPQFVRSLRVRLPIQPGKGYHVDVDRPERCPQIPAVLMEERIFVSPLDDFFRLAGTMEFSGFNLSQRPERLQMLLQGAGRYFPQVPQLRVRSRWCHWRPMTPDGLPVIGRVPRTDNVWLAAGHGMLGMTQGPITGQLLAEWICHGHTSLDLTPLRLDRF